MQLAITISNWCVEIEISADLIERAEIYNIYEIKNKRF